MGHSESFGPDPEHPTLARLKHFREAIATRLFRQREREPQPLVTELDFTRIDSSQEFAYLVHYERFHTPRIVSAANLLPYAPSNITVVSRDEGDRISYAVAMATPSDVSEDSAVPEVDFYQVIEHKGMDDFRPLILYNGHYKQSEIPEFSQEKMELPAGTEITMLRRVEFEELTYDIEPLDVEAGLVRMEQIGEQAAKLELVIRCIEETRRDPRE